MVESNRPGADWPEGGEVVIKDYSTRYRPGLDLVLKGITCSFNKGEKVGLHHYIFFLVKATLSIFFGQQFLRCVEIVPDNRKTYHFSIIPSYQNRKSRILVKKG